MLALSSLQLTVGVKIFETYADCSVSNQKKSYHILYFIQMLQDNFYFSKNLKNYSGCNETSLLHGHSYTNIGLCIEFVFLFQTILLFALSETLLT
jgi:hypothetical protein